MTPTPEPTGGPRTATAPPDRIRRVLRAVAITACVPYLALKTAWLGGSRIGMPEDSLLLDDPAVTAVANLVTLVLDAWVIVLALLLTRPWGRRVPAWLLVVPMWTATGLLAPIMTAYPLQLLVRALGGGGPGGSAGDGGGGGEGAEPFLHEWVFGMVYGGFIVQGLSLGALFALYARDRWGHLWRDRVRDLPPAGAAPRAVTCAAALVALVPATLHTLWASGFAMGADGTRLAGRSTGELAVMEATSAVFPLVAVAGAGLLVLGRDGARWVGVRARARAPVRARVRVRVPVRVRVRVPVRVRVRVRVPVWVALAAAWLGSGATATWGGWISLASLGGGGIASGTSGPMYLAYACQMIAGALVAAVGARFLAGRARAHAGATPAPVRPTDAPASAAASTPGPASAPAPVPRPWTPDGPDAGDAPDGRVSP
ncbi:hypothetical protein [Streptomyces uncialis]|uniref:hypothetical protein n=1 Tax=Streptomyces uncialis TaxID=1048205 RepID=UPI0022555E23|nr:hypothetical protein [Streptomyces uncialis]MCX4663069.1 hypothetical protein [Streptomyces uncialis]